MFGTRTRRLVTVEGKPVWLRDRLQFDPEGTKKQAEERVSRLEVIGAQNRLNDLMWQPPGLREMVLKPGIPIDYYSMRLREYRDAIDRYKRELKDYRDKHPVFFGLRANERIDCPLLATVEHNAET